MSTKFYVGQTDYITQLNAMDDNYNLFKSKWYGAATTDPTLNPLGGAIAVGDAYFNLTSNLLKIYNGTTWQASDINTANLAATGGAALIGNNTAGGSAGATVQAALDAKANLAGANFTGPITSTGTVQSGSGSAGTSQNIVANGGASGTAAGAALIAQTNTSTIIAIGNKSGVAGGTYDATPYIYGSAAISTNVGMNIGGTVNSTGLAATVSSNTVVVSADTTGSYIEAQNSKPLRLYAGGAQQVWVDPSGNVGIGSISPIFHLHVDDTTGANKNSIGVGNTANGLVMSMLASGDAHVGLYAVGGALRFGHSNGTVDDVIIDASGNMLVGATSGSNHVIAKSITSDAGNPILGIQGASAFPAQFYGISVGTSSANAANSAVKVGKDGTTSRSMSAAGTINASGADYAEYMTKADTCGILAKGQIVGVDASGKLTDKWVDSVSFVIKSTNPSYVGGDTWGTEEAIGKAPVKPDTEDETELANYETAITDFNAKLEAARQKVDRIAYAGQVPVNVLGANPGEYIVPVQDGDGIKGIAVSDSDITFAQFRKAVGIVQNILADGRANVRVKVV